MLNGVRVLDLSWVLGGPFAGQLLAQLGAEVIKIEPPAGDSARSIPPYFVSDESSFYLSVNRGKRSVALDLRSPQGLATFYDLVKESDAVIYGFRADVPAKLGIDFETLKRVNPRICVGQLIGLHDDEEFASVPAFDLVVQALSGLMSITGESGRPPVRVGYQVADLAGGAYLALSVVAGLFAAQRNGTGVHTQVSLLDCQLSLLTWQAQNFFISGESPQAAGSRHHMIAPSEAFQGSDGKYFVISPTGEKFWKMFCTALGKDELAGDPRFATAKDRIANVEELSAELRGLFSHKPCEVWVKELTAAGIPAAPVLSVAEALSQPVVRKRQMVEELTDPASGQQVRFLGNPFKQPSGETETLGFPPRLGADGAELLSTICGYSADQIDALVQDGVLKRPGQDDPSADRTPERNYP
jgi:CoA:oxalate CoA-transferase